MGEQRWALKWLSFSNRKMKGYHMGCCLPGSGAVTHVHSALEFSLLPAGGRWQWPDSHTLISRAGATDGATATGMSVKDHFPPPPPPPATLSPSPSGRHVVLVPSFSDSGGINVPHHVRCANDLMLSFPSSLYRDKQCF